MRFFTHDTGLRKDPKICKLIKEHGVEGYAFWMGVLEQFYQIERKEIALETLCDYICEPLQIDASFAITVLNTAALTGLINNQRWQDKFIVPVDLKFERRSGYQKHREAVFDRDGYKCVYCGATERLTLDHVIPVSRDGSDTPDNLACCCHSCNSKKRDRTPDEWMEEKL